MKHALAAVLLGCVLATTPGCDDAELRGPPTIRLGRDECAGCGMIVSEDRFSAALLIERNGRREHAVFDDLGCQLDFEFDRSPEFQVIDRFAHDHGTRLWLKLDSATFLYADPRKAATPMGSGILTFDVRAAAEKARDELGGEIMDFARLVPARRAWVQGHFGKPRGGP